MRSRTVSLMVAVALAAGPASASAQTDISETATDLPPTLFEPAPDSLPRRTAVDEATGAPLLLAGLLLAGAAAAGYFTGSSRRTRRS